MITYKLPNTDFKIGIIGDVHLGKRFEVGVPLNRRGERERMVLNQFRAELDQLDEVDCLVQVGDIFDKFRVPYEVIVETSDAIELRARRHLDKQIFIMRGNHDASRDLEKVSAFDILRKLLVHQNNVVFITDESVNKGAWNASKSAGASLGFAPWHPLKTARELVEELHPCDVIFGHWDVIDFNNDNPNLIPIGALAERTKQVFTGHDHSRRELEFGDLKVTVTGSLQPYSHAEDPNGDLYVTMTKLAFDQMQHPEMLKNKCVRILLEEGETLPDDLDCLQLTAKRLNSIEDEEIEVELGDFNMEALFTEAFKEQAITDDVASEFLEKFREQRTT